MKLRNIIISAIALALTASFTSCDKDDDNKDNTIDPYGFWKMLDADSVEAHVGVSALYYRIMTDSIFVYAAPSADAAEAYGYSTDTAYRMPNVYAVKYMVANSDSVVITAKQTKDDVYHYCKFVLIPVENSRFMFVETSEAGVDTVFFSRASGVKWSDDF